MYYVLDIPFYSQQEASTKLGNIKMFYVGQRHLGYPNSNKKYRKYILNSTDINKLSNINNAADGSTAYVVDTQQIYYLSNGQWYTS